MSQSSPCLWTRLPQSCQSPRDRYKHACCSSDGQVYILGGRGSSCLKDFWRYSGFLYVFGGMLDSAYTSRRHPLWVFDIAKQKWVHCTGKSGPTQAQTPSNRKSHSAVVVGAAMLVYGGFVDMKGSSQDFWSLDFNTMVWSQLSDSQQGSSGPGPGPGPRHCHSAMAHQSCMYLFGGLKGLREQRDFWKWNSTSSSWTALKNKSGPSRLMGHSSVAYRDSMLLFGGGESQNSPNNCLWRYSFTTQTWTQVTTLPGSNPPAKIHHCCVGLGPSYKSSTSSPDSSLGHQTRQLEARIRPFKNKCFPAPLTFLGSEGAIELETFTPERCYGTKLQSTDVIEKIGNCLTFENKAFRKQCSDEEEEEEEEDVAQHLPDLLLVLGGRPCSRQISLWQMTLTDS